MPRRSKLLLPLAAVLALGPLAACSDDAASEKAAPAAGLTLAQVRERPCSLVSEDTVSAALQHAVEAASKDGAPCTYTATTAGASSAVVELRTRAAADAPSRLLPNGRAVDGVGSVARFDPQGGPLGPRLVAREAGTLVIVDLGPVELTDTKAEGKAATIARAALKRAARTKVAAVRKAAADGPCERLGEGEALAKALDGAVTVTPLYPTGCAVSITGRGGATIQSEALAGSGAKVIAGLTRATDGKEWPKSEVEDLGEAAAWLADPTNPGAGQLTVAADDRLLTVTTDASSRTAADGQKLAVATAKVVLD